MTALRSIIARQIAATGPLTIADYMTLCLLHPEHGYYTTRDPLGAAGDFVTAPEISQMFGELLGLALAQCWRDQGAPASFALAELGPGRGTLMADMLRATRGVPGFHDAARLHMVEASPTLRTAQARAVPGVTHHDTAETLPEGPLFLVANEFFDALPVRQMLRDGEQWRERVVGLTDDRLAFGLSSPLPLAGLAHRLGDTATGDMVQLSPAAATIAETLGHRIAAHGGAALVIDYGDWRVTGDTFQAVRGHTRADPLEAPGTADLTAHVDFETIARAAPCAHSAPTPQGVFLERLGITARAQTLARALDGDALANHVAAHRRLTHPDEMGTLFKVMALHPEGAAPPPGLDP
ncbi:SAM-dependent methyltransferase [Roseovarius sp. SCSIO 43702]|uniref:class I SAM-dependent methyltransferase n=1 Tax=Roseovarius sp. SCSIO 43702 TaxID=2823043 RepID=UPI001C72A74E|nr:SAM-dependent methyltransferase [Roseovarius sp. SCSIO 43702]QYX57863.1 SAM-dependent methyltransferase [Roseovarius sp. SCSIO 43702]